MTSQVAFLQLSEFHKSAKQPQLQRPILVNGNDQPFPFSRHRENVVTSLYPRERPSLALSDRHQLLPRNLFHSASSMTRSCSPSSASGVSTESQPSIASRKLAVISSRVSPWVKHPGKAGTSAQNPPSSATWTIAF